MRTLRKFVLGAIGSLAAASPLPAHHEWPIDQTKRIRVQGTVTAFTWGNPHVMIALDVEANGAIETWTVGGSSPQFMTTCGWNKKSLKPGDVVTVIGVLHPAANVVYSAAKAKNQEQMIEVSDALSATCTGCHRRFRDRRGPAGRCTLAQTK